MKIFLFLNPTFYYLILLILFGNGGMTFDLSKNEIIPNLKVRFSELTYEINIFLEQFKILENTWKY